VSRILGLETSCDETAAAVVEAGQRVTANVIWSQHPLHEAYGGVVPEIASRAHLERLYPILTQALTEADCRLDQLEAVAVGNRPGLIGSLIVGVSAAKALAWALDRPVIGVDHVQAHLCAAVLSVNGSAGAEAGDATHEPDPWPVPGPALGLVVSGGHTSLYRVDGPRGLHRLGGTIDDAVGEAFDKAAAILEAGYPGGPAIESLAESGDPAAHELPESLLGKESLDFSFSGLKTALLYSVRGRPQGRGREATFERSVHDLTHQQRADLAAAFQEAAIGAVMVKLERALKQLKRQDEPPRALIVGGGVSANRLLRKRLAELAERYDLPLYVPPMALCVDNAAMIAGLAWHHWQAGAVDSLELPAMPTGAD
jgi:N6-L-threonylcarbamoyladenine synthase